MCEIGYCHFDGTDNKKTLNGHYYGPGVPREIYQSLNWRFLVVLKPVIVRLLCKNC